MIVIFVIFPIFFQLFCQQRKNNRLHVIGTLAAEVMQREMNAFCQFAFFRFFLRDFIC